MGTNQKLHDLYPSRLYLYNCIHSDYQPFCQALPNLLFKNSDSHCKGLLDIQFHILSQYHLPEKLLLESASALYEVLSWQHELCFPLANAVPSSLPPLML